MQRCHLAFPLAILLLSGCASLNSKEQISLARTGMKTQFESAKTAEYVANQTAVYNSLKQMTSKTTPTDDEVINAGMQYADTLCSDYIEALYWVNKQLKADVRDVNALGTLTASAMGIAKSAANSIAGAAVLFGFAEDSLNNMGSRVLFELEPSSIRALVEGSQKSFRGALPSGYQGQAAVFTVVREYISLCIPSRIEAEINNAAKTALPVASEGNAAKGEAPKVSTNANQVKLSTQAYASNFYSEVLKSYVFPGGVKDAKAYESLSSWLRNTQKITDPVSIFLMSAKYKDQWKDAIDYLSNNGNPRLE